jgi:hypothetical protein
MRSFFVIILIISSFALTVSAQSESDLKTYFEGKQVTLRIDMPATSGGVNVYPERAQSMNYDEHNERLKDHGASMLRGDKATISKVSVKDRHIEVQFAGSSRFNIHFARVEPWMLTPATVIDALNRYVAFSEADKKSARLQPSNVVAAGYVRQGVVHLGPKTTYLKEGLKKQEVVKLLGAPTSVAERGERGSTVETYEFERGEGRVLIAEFVNDVLVGSRTEVRSSRSVAVLSR